MIIIKIIILYFIQITHTLMIPSTGTRLVTIIAPLNAEVWWEVEGVTMCVGNRFDCGRCVPGQVEHMANAPLKAVLRGLGGWPVISNDWDRSNWTLEVVLGHLKGKHKEAVLIQMMVATDDKNSSAHIMQVKVAVTGSGRFNLITVTLFVL